MLDSELSLFWYQADTFAKSILAVLVVMSVLSWSLLLYKLWQLHQWRNYDRRAQHALLALSFKATPKVVGPVYGQVWQTGIVAYEQYLDATPSVGLNDWLSSRLHEIVNIHSTNLQNGLTVLASIASTAPFVGLLGTVWGIYHAMMNISGSGSANIDIVAGPVGEALVMTAIGLLVAIPAVIIYNGLNRANRKTAQNLVRFAQSLYAHLLLQHTCSSSQQDHYASSDLSPKTNRVGHSHAH